MRMGSLLDDTFDKAEDLSGLPGKKGKERIVETGNSE